MSVIARGVKTPGLDTFAATANAPEISADALLTDVDAHEAASAAPAFSAAIAALPHDEMVRVLKAIHVRKEE